MKPKVNSSFFASVLQYNDAHKERIEEICSPLKTCFDISYFGYFRIFNDGRYNLISNCPALKEAIFFYDYVFRTEYCKIFPQKLSKYEQLRFIFPDDERDEAFEFMKCKEVYNHFNIIKENAGTLEGYYFGTDHESVLIRNFYGSHADSLEDFVHYFKTIAKELIDPTDIARQGILPFVRSTYPQIENIFNNRTPWEEKIIKFNALLNSNVEEEIRAVAKRNLLSYREVECLSHSSTGMTAKEIARVLGIGYRTVQTHLDNVRLKTGCQTKRELTYWFEEKFKCFLTTE